MSIYQSKKYSTLISPIVVSYPNSDRKMMGKCTYEFLHDLWVVSMEDGCSKPAHVELDVSLSCLYVL